MEIQEIKIKNGKWLIDGCSYMDCTPDQQLIVDRRIELGLFKLKKPKKKINYLTLLFFALIIILELWGLQILISRMN